MSEDLPSWARRIRSMREAHNWSQTTAADKMRKHSTTQLTTTEHLARRWKAWELGRSKPSTFYQPLIAATLGTVTSALFPPQENAAAGTELLSATGMDTLEIVSRLKASDVNDATLEAVRITVDKLCSEYSRQSPLELVTEGRQWLRRLVELQEQRLTFRQRRESLELAGWLTLLVGCLEYDLGDRRAAEATRQSALSLGKEVGSGGIIGWAHEMQAWFALTSGDLRSVIAASEAGEQAAGNHSVRVQLIAQQAKAYARMGRREDMQHTLERGRVALEGMPYPGNVDNHFVVDPTKYDFYAMDCYRYVGENRLAREFSHEAIRVSSGYSGQERWPMRTASAQITLGVVAAREGDLDEAVTRGQQALSINRKSLPSLIMVASDLATVLTDRYAGEPETEAYVEQLRSIQRGV